jgi:hypothetical protein
MPTLKIKINDVFFKFIRIRALEEQTAEPEFFIKLVEREYQRNLRELHAEYQRAEISLGYLAREMGLGRREVEDVLEQQGLKVSNI